MPIIHEGTASQELDSQQLSSFAQQINVKLTEMQSKIDTLASPDVSKTGSASEPHQAAKELHLAMQLASSVLERHRGGSRTRMSI